MTGPEPQPRILLGEPQQPPIRREQLEGRLARLCAGLVGVGLALAVIGWVDAGLLFWPPKFGDAEWEFVIITNFFNALPVATLGTTLLAVGAAAGGRPRVTRLAMAACVLLVAALVALTAVYLLDVPVALAGTPPASRWVLYRSLLKTGAFATIYTAFYAWLVWFLSRRARGRFGAEPRHNQ